MSLVRYRYNQQVQPPAPFIYVMIHHPVGHSATERLPALLDSGADITAVPADVANQLALTKFSDVILAGYMGPTMLVESYVVNLTLHDFDVAAVEVVLTDSPYVILGCDVLNQFHITLDGPHLRLEIQLP
jgi:gag-polyprotein putative aspartyl protease